MDKETLQAIYNEMDSIEEIEPHDVERAFRLLKSSLKTMTGAGFPPTKIDAGDVISKEEFDEMQRRANKINL